MNTEPKHTPTPGPWRLAQCSTLAEIYVTIRGFKQTLAFVNSCCHNDLEGNANARLIAVAPDMAALLNQAVNGRDGLCAEEWRERAAALLAGLLGPLAKTTSDTAEGATNANLIAAPPEMVEALKQCRQAMEAMALYMPWPGSGTSWLYRDAMLASGEALKKAGAL